MKSLKRRIFFWTLVILFCLTAPIVVLHARGYRFDKTRGVFVYSGTVTFKANPQDILISINNQLSEAKQLNRMNSSYNVTGLIPGEYDIKISAPGFNGWRKKAYVHSGLATEFWNVLLTRNQYIRQDLLLDNIDRFYTSPKNEFIAYTLKNNTDTNINIYSIEDKEVVNNLAIAGWKLIDETQKKENIEWSPKDDYISVPVERKIPVTSPKVKGLLKTPAASTATEEVTEYNYFVIDIENDTTINLGELYDKKEITLVRWDPQDKDYLFFLSANTLYRANIRNKEDVVEIAKDIWTYDLSHSKVFYAQKANNLIFQTDLDGQSDKAQLTNSFPQENEPAIERLIVYDDQRIAILSASKDLYVFNKADRDTYFRKIGASVEGVHFSDDGKKLLLWTNNEISTYFVRDWDVQPIRREDELSNITRYANDIKNVQWYKDYEHIIFSSGRWIKIIELDPRDQRNCLDLTSTETETPFVRYNNFLEKVYFTDAKDTSSSLYQVQFPEPVALLDLGE